MTNVPADASVPDFSRQAASGSPLQTSAGAVVDDALEATPADAELERLVAAYGPLDFESRLRRLYQDFDPARILVTSSFAATSAYFLHIISRICPEQPIHFIDTGFHFPETLAYRQYLIDRFGLTVRDVRAEDWKHQFTADDRTYEKNPDFCCSINKVEPIEAIKPQYDVWVSSLMRWQSDHRAGLQVFERRRGLLKCNPMIDVSREQRDAYISEHQLPFHPLVEQGYQSIGCTHCTVAGEGRSGRWIGKPKTECGLHL